MKIKDIIYNTPEITEEKLLEFIKLSIPMIKRNNSLMNRIIYLHHGKDLAQAFLDEYDAIQDKKSYLTKQQRDIVTGFVGLCMIKMVKADGSGSEDTVGNIPEVEDSRDDSNIGE